MKRKFYSILMFALLSLLLTACNPFEPFTNLIKLGQQALRPETEGITPPPTVTMIVPTPTSIDVTIVSTEPQATEHLASLESSPTAALLTPLSVETNAAIERPDVYQLQPGEYSFCLARRYDIHPADLNRYNGLNTRQQFQPGQQINLPPQARPFPWERALLLHPADYSVRPGDTIYSIACYYGDVDPIALATANRLTAPYLLEAGQVLQIPGASQYVAAQVQPVVPVATESAAEIPNPIATTKIILSSSTSSAPTQRYFHRKSSTAYTHLDPTDPETCRESTDIDTHYCSRSDPAACCSSSRNAQSAVRSGLC